MRQAPVVLLLRAGVRHGDGTRDAAKGGAQLACERWPFLLPALRRLGIRGPLRGLRLRANPRGKPQCASPWARGLSFSVSHSGPLTALAVWRGPQLGMRLGLGLDLEDAGRDLARPGALARRLGLPADSPRQALLRQFNAQEAVWKAWGSGLGGHWGRRSWRGPAGVPRAVRPQLRGSGMPAGGARTAGRTGGRNWWLCQRRLGGRLLSLCWDGGGRRPGAPVLAWGRLSATGRRPCIAGASLC